MKTTIITAALAAATLISSPAFASAALAGQKNCAGCHSAENKMMGPSYKDIAAKYAGQKDAEAKLAEKIVKGGSGVWGGAPMPPNPGVSADDAKTLAKWALSGGK